MLLYIYWMKTCSKCFQKKLESDYFYKDKIANKLHAQCKSCYKEHRKTYQAAHYAAYKEKYLLRARTRRDIARNEYRKKMLEYLKDKQCTMCNEADIRTFEFDHVDPSKKKFNISQGVRLGYKWSEILEELSACRILCANCHKKHTAYQAAWYKNV